MTKAKKAKETPLMRQYNAIKAKHPGALLLFRVGDFYETFGEDAIKASKILDIVLTKRANGAASHVELAGFPHHALDSYLPKLIRAGERVAICDQLEDPKTVKGIVKRGVTELVTPGLSYDDNVLERESNNFITAIHQGTNHLGVSFLDISTGEYLVAEGNHEAIERLVHGFRPAEVLVSKNLENGLAASVAEKTKCTRLEDWSFQFDFGYEKLTQHFQTNSLKGFGIEDLKDGIASAGAILQYLEDTEHHRISHIRSISRIDNADFVWLDRFTIRNLELISAQQSDGKPLIEVVDHTKTPMGSRLLKKWILLPLQSEKAIKARHDIVEALIKDPAIADPLSESLSAIADLERLISKVSIGRVGPREIVHLNQALAHTGEVKSILTNSGVPLLKTLGKNLDPCPKLTKRIGAELQEEVPLSINQGGVIADGVNEELDELRKIAYSGKDYLLQIRDREVKKTGISSLKIAYNKVFGYYLEVSNVHKDKVPQDWIRKQTLVNAERYVTEELKKYEESILNAEEKISVLEQQLYDKLVGYAAEFLNEIQQDAQILAQTDCLLSFAAVSQAYTYCRPTIDDSLIIDIKGGRHPVIERQLPHGEPYVPNDVFLDNDEQQVMIITGPNMAGKSALLRQTALIVLLAQIGCFVPAESARIGLVDKIFTRVGASDNLSQGESTFMVEMTETASILNNLSDRSLILMDEIGRGTSTYDGVSIAWAITEYLHNNSEHRPKTLFATHYHELNQLTNDLPRVKNYNVSVKEVGGKVLFVRKLEPGGSEHSFGIHVAQMAGMPNPIVLRANEIMRFLEKDHQKEKKDVNIPRPAPREDQLSLFQPDSRLAEIRTLIDQIDVNTLSPIEALLKLNELKLLMDTPSDDTKED